MHLEGIFQLLMCGPDIGAPVPSEARTGWNWFSSFWYGTRLPLGQRGAVQNLIWPSHLLLDSIWDETASGTARSSKLMLWTAHLLLDSVWDETASGTARSRKELKLPSWCAPQFIMGQNCIWDSEELKVDSVNNWSAPRFSMGQNCLWDSEEQDNGKLWISLAVWDWEELQTILGPMRS